jgi:DNA-directed RNA polymerase specialized sigma24 family protein
VSRAEDRTFASFVAQRSTTLLRTAYLLTGDRVAAVDLLQQALVVVHRHWSELPDDEAATARARRELVAVHTGWRRRLWWGDLLASSPVLADVRGFPGFALPAADTGPRDPTTTALARLPAGLRAALVLRYGEELPEPAAAQLLDCAVEQLRARTERGLSRLQGLLAEATDEPDDDVVRRLRHDLAARAGQVTAPPDGLVEQVEDAERAQRRNRAGLGVLVAFVVLVVVLVAVTL